MFDDVEGGKDLAGGSSFVQHSLFDIADALTRGLRCFRVRLETANAKASRSRGFKRT